MIVTAFISDRGDQHLPDLLRSYRDNIHGGSKIYKVIDDRDHRLGLAGAVRAAWEWALSTDADYLFHCEEDWLFERRIDLHAMAWIVGEHPHLAQMCLRRGVELRNAQEAAAGGFVEAATDQYRECWDDDLAWMEHTRCFSLNPCVIPRDVLELGWDDDNERGFTARLIEKGYRFGIWGSKADPPAVTHTGIERAVGWKP